MITIGGKDIADIVIDNKEVIRVQDANTLEIMWQKTTPVVVDYFYIENTFNGSNSIIITTYSNSPTGNHATTLQYSKDKTNWTNITLSGTNTISMDSGDKVYFRNDNGYFNWYNSSSNRFVTNLNCSENFNVGGNINSLLDYTNSNVSLSPYCFYSLFNDSTSFKLVNASNLTLPSTTLAEHCYERMFYNRSNLTTIPTLPATTLADYCYSYMFSGCTSLTTPPSLPATTLEDYCYQRMFSGCRALTSTPTLSSTTLADYCYSYMFTGCTSLTTAPSLPATTLSGACYNNMFSGCTALTTPPTLPATTLESSCYNRMFYNCSSLNYINVYANDISASNCIVNWLYGVASTGTFNNFGSASYTYPSASGIPQGWSEVSYNEYFYIENAYNGSNTISISSTNKGSTGTWASSLQYSKDKNTWTTVSLADDFNPVTISMNSGEKVYFRNNNGYFNYITSGYNRITTFNCNKDFNVGGNINTLLNYQDVTNVSLSQNCFTRLLKEDIRYSTHLKDASNLILPSMTLAQGCYASMFNGCSSLTTPPVLPATTLANNCYASMFSNCWSLTTAPSLPATTLAKDCYASMFNECLVLTIAPTLPAPTLVEECYASMFDGCTLLNSITIYANDISATRCLNYWVGNVASTGTFHNLGSAIYPINSVSGIPSGWTEVHS